MLYVRFALLFVLLSLPLATIQHGTYDQLVEGDKGIDAMLLYKLFKRQQECQGSSQHCNQTNKKCCPGLVCKCSASSICNTYGKCQPSG
uniref:Gsp_36 putative toxin n=1 Tax=Gemmula speciosa TaxID=439592 RepID=A0A098LW74_GEMSP